MNGTQPPEMLDDVPTSGASAPRLEVHGLEIMVAKSSVAVVQDVSFSLGAGQVIGLVGESGSGKTTAALALLGYARRGLRITKGRVLLDGIDILALGASQLRSVRGSAVAYIPQDPSAALNPGLKIGTQLREALTSHPGTTDDVDARIAEVLRDTRLDDYPDLLKRYPHQLSGGQQQRVAIAMAFACRASLIVLDEPTTGLDVSTQRHVLSTVRELCASYGTSAVYISHDLAVVAGIASAVAVMYSGRIVESGPMASMFARPVHPYTRGLLAAIPSPDRAEVLTGIEGQAPRPGRRQSGCSFGPRCSFAVDACRAKVPEAIGVEGHTVRCIRTHEIPAYQVHARQSPVAPMASHSDHADLRIESVNAFYGKHQVLRDVSLLVRPEQCLAVVGESGSGKTTLARCIVGIHSNWQGSISVRDTALAGSFKERPKEMLRKVQYIFQNPYTSLNPRKTIGQILSQPLDHYFDLTSEERSRRIVAALRDVSLEEDYVHRFPDQLSGGQRQRVAIARALVVEPEILICDEITSALDVSVQATIVELLRRLQRERHVAIVFITHNLALVRSIAQESVVLRGGQVVESGPTEEVLSRPTDPYTIRLMQDVPKLPGADAARSRGTVLDVEGDSLFPLAEV